jgi:uncharacterized protein (DUF1015 family)
MATLHPFRALRPAPATAAVVSSVPYDVVTTDEARQLAAGNPLSFLRVTRSELDLPPGTDPYSPSVYAKARENFEYVKAQAPLVIEDAPSLYFYRLRMGDHEQTGVAGCFSLNEYDAGIIKKHERTRRDKEDDRTRHIIELRAQTGVVFLTYPRAAAVDDLTPAAAAGTSLYDFTAPDGVRHTVWRADAASTRALVASFADIPALYIADGHHRAASAARARVELPEFDTFIAVAFPDNQTQILPYHRVVKDLAGQTPSQLLAAIAAQFPVTEGPATPRRKGEVSMYLDGKWYTIDLSNAAPADETRASQLDVALLQHHILERLLNIGDIRHDKRIDFVGGARGTDGLERAVTSGSASVAFSMFPVRVEDLIAISDAGAIMPPKSTWFEPKLRDGLLIHAIS